MLPELIEKLVDFSLPIIMVNDGSGTKEKALFQTLSDNTELLTVLHHDTNLGKGAAVQTGLKAAFLKGFTHALQVDADGQHNLADVEKLLTKSNENPLSLISGLPVYDESVPKHRYYARNITHFWVWVETLSFQIKDTMCGFRVYPLNSTVDLITKQSLGNRMDFDIEVMVKLYWNKVSTIFIPTAVEYPEHGISHFRPLADNILISWMHTRLCFGMLLRSPQLIFRKFS